MSHTAQKTQTPLAAARALLQAGDIDGAEAAIAAIGTQPPHAAAAILHARCAAARGDWHAALQRWQHCRTAFPDRRADAEIGRGHALLHLGQLDESQMAFEAARALEPYNLSVVVGLARVATRRRRPEEAAALWQHAVAEAHQPALPAWHMGLAHAQLEAGDASAALKTVKNLEREQPSFRGTLGLHARLLVELGLRYEAVTELATGRFSPGSGQRAERLRLLIFLGDLAAARAEFAINLGEAETAVAHERLFLNIPLLFPPEEQRRLWRDLRHRLTPMARAGDADAAALLLRIAVAEAVPPLAHGTDGATALVAEIETAPPLPPPWGTNFQRLAHILRAPPDSAPRIFGIGLPRTGTSSLTRALDQLGWLAAHFRSPFSGAMLTEADIPLFNAATDAPVCVLFERLYEAYPTARFILTHRPLAAWQTSFNTLYAHTFGTADFPTLRAKCSQGETLRYGQPWAALHTELFFRYPSAAAAWRAYHARVDAFFANKPGKLLRIDVTAGEGWTELCGFLDADVPDGAFPHENRSRK